MSNDQDPIGLGWFHSRNPYADAFRDFERDVHVLVLWAVEAGVSGLEAEAQKEEDKLAPYKESKELEVQERLQEEIEHIWQYFGDQEKFLRNMALVGLLSRLIHVLKDMARSGDLFATRKKSSYRKQGDSEFMEIWREYQKRFGIDLIDAEKARVEFLLPLYAARNKIVHYGGEANHLKHADDVDLYGGDEGLLDLSFSKLYPQFVSGEGFGAEIAVSEKQLDEGVEASLLLVRWLSELLYEKQLDDRRAESSSSAPTV